MTGSASSAQVLVRLLAIFSAVDQDEVRLRTIETISEFFDAGIVGILNGSGVVDSVGLGHHSTELESLAAQRSGASFVESDAFGPMYVLALPIPDSDGATFVLARASSAFSHEESMAARASIRMMQLAC
ncbi:MAG: hypothetical protein V3V01_17825, partial [Acidimicrobiales bacterium]